MTDDKHCHICHLPLAETVGRFQRGATFDFACDCKRCGYYQCDFHCWMNVLPNLSAGDRARLSGAVREAIERQSGRYAFEVSEEIVPLMLAAAPESFDVDVKARKLLSAVARRTPAPGEWVVIDQVNDLPLAFATHIAELIYITEYLKNQGWCEKQYREKDLELMVTPSGWEENVRRPRIESAQGFVAMWFGDRDWAATLTDAYENGFRAAIEDDCGFKAMRIDGKEFNGDIVDEIIVEIRSSRFVVADLTGQRGGVYFEGGFAKGLGVETIWTCHADHADRTHFDTNHQKQIRWSNASELRTQLAARIGATIGKGPFQKVRV